MSHVVCEITFVLLGDPFSSSDYKPGFLTDEELKQLVVEVRMFCDTDYNYKFFVRLLMVL